MFKTMCCCICFMMLAVSCVAISLRHLGPTHKHSLIKQNIFQSTIYSVKPVNSRSIIDIESTVNPIISITQFGGDWTGINDSTIAFQSAISLALTYGASNHNMAGVIKDCGAVTIDLQGGDYIISNTLQIPQYYGNIHIIDGTIRASNNFTSTYLFMIGNIGNNCSQYNCNQNILFENVMFDCQHNCDGALYINHCIGCIIGPGIIIHGFNKYGITAIHSHGTLIYAAWIGQYWWLSQDYNNYTKVDSIAINLQAPDSNLRDLIIFSARYGITISSVNNMLTNIHTWNYNEHIAPNTSAVSGIVIQNTAQNTRIVDSYLDWVNLVMLNPNCVTVQDSFFLGGGAIILQSTKPNQTIQSLIILNNEFSSGSWNNYTDTIMVDETDGHFVSVLDTYIDNMIINIAYNRNKYVGKSTKMRKKLTKYGAMQWVFDFTEELLFDAVDIGWIDYSFQLLGEYNRTVQHNLLSTIGKIVIVQTNIKCDGTVYMTVDQSVST